MTNPKHSNSERIVTGEAHTPGPWVYDDAFSLILRLADNGERVDTEVAAIHSGESMHTKRTDKGVAQANARLIATAPDLLEACRAVVEDLEHYVKTHGEGPDKRLLFLKQAIAKAEGRGE